MWKCKKISVIVWWCKTNDYVWFGWVVIVLLMCILVIMFWCLYVSSPLLCGCGFTPEMIVFYIRISDSKSVKEDAQH